MTTVFSFLRTLHTVLHSLPTLCRFPSRSNIKMSRWILLAPLSLPQCVIWSPTCSLPLRQLASWSCFLCTFPTHSLPSLWLLCYTHNVRAQPLPSRGCPLLLSLSLGARLAVRPPQVLSVSVVCSLLLGWSLVRAHENTSLLNSWLFTAICLWSWHLQVGLTPVFLPRIANILLHCFPAYSTAAEKSNCNVILSSFSFLASLGLLSSAWALHCESVAVRHVGILAPHPGTEPTSRALEGGFLTTAPPGSPWHVFLYKWLGLCNQCPGIFCLLRVRWLPWRVSRLWTVLGGRCAYEVQFQVFLLQETCSKR